jgi:hypothetical protein
MATARAEEEREEEEEEEEATHHFTSAGRLHCCLRHRS